MKVEVRCSRRGEMEDAWLFKEGLRLVQWQKNGFLRLQVLVSCPREKSVVFMDHYRPILWALCLELRRFLLFLLIQWKDCVVRGMGSLMGLGYAAIFVIIWSYFLSLTSASCLVYAILMLGSAGATIRYLGNTPGLFIVGLCGILLLLTYGNLWKTGMLSIITDREAACSLIRGPTWNWICIWSQRRLGSTPSSYLFSLNHARLLVFIATAYAIYCVKARVGFLGVFLSLNLAFLSNDLLSYVLQEYETVSESTMLKDNNSCPHSEEFAKDSSFSAQAGQPESFSSCMASGRMPNGSQAVEKNASTEKVVKTDTSSLDEIKRILDSKNHYESLGFARSNTIDPMLLRKEYRKKAVLVHPDKNMGVPSASESFKKLQCAYEVLSDTMRRKNYDDQLRKGESGTPQLRRHGSPQQTAVGYRTAESRRIHCTKCGNIHIWMCTNRLKAKARWCQDCQQHHQAKDGDGWVEIGSISIGLPRKVEIPRAYVCAESKIFDVSEWAFCQEMTCKPNAHGSTFHVNIFELGNVQRSKSEWNFAWDAGNEMRNGKKDGEFDVWLQQSLGSGLFSNLTETSSRRRWSLGSFSLNQKKLKKHWRSDL